MVNQDPDRLLDVVNRYDADKSRRDSSAFIDERFPDFWTDFTRRCEILSDGRRREKFFDLGARRAS
jgi:hypothetical protein